MGKRKVNVQQGKQGFQPTDHSAGKVSPTALADDLARAKGPADTSLTAGMSAEQVNSIYDGFAARKEAERLAEERRPLVEAMLQEDRAAREQAENEQRQRDQRKCFDSFQSIPESERPELSPGDLDLLKKDERVRYVAGNGTHTAQSAQVVGYLMLRARRRTPDLSPQEVVSDAVNNVRANRGASDTLVRTGRGYQCEVCGYGVLTKIPEGGCPKCRKLALAL